MDASHLACDGMAALFWSAANLLLFACAWRLGRWLFPTDPDLTALLHTVLLWSAAVVGVTIALGSVGLLYPPLALGVVLAGAAAGLYYLPRPRPADSSDGPSRERPWLVLWAGVFCLLLAHVVVSGLTTFPTDVDSLTYHVPLIRYWLQAGNLYAPDGSHWSFPGNLELVGAWVVGPFSGDFLIPLTNLPSAVLLALGAVELARSLRLGSVLCHAVGLSAVANFIVFRQLLDAENDVLVVGLFVGCLAYGFRHLRGGGRADLALAAVCCGLLSGVKYYALGYGAVAWGTVILVLAVQGRTAVAAAAYGAASVTLFGGYWYARNWVVSGTPLYPMGAGSSDELGAVFPSVWSTTLLGYGQADAVGLYLDAVWVMVGPLGYLSLVAAPAAAGWLAWTGTRSLLGGDPVAGAQRLGLVAAAAGCAALVLVTPFLVENIPDTQNQLRERWTPARYSLSLLALTVVMLAICSGDCTGGAFLRGSPSGRPAARCAATGPTVAFAALGVFQLVTVNRAGWLPIRPLDTFLLATNLFLVGLIAWLVTSGGEWAKWRSWAAGVLLVMITTGFAPYLSDRWHTGFVPFYDAHFKSSVFGRLQAPAPPVARVCAVNLTEVYPFFGPRGNVRVVQPVRASTPEQLREYMAALGVEVIVTKIRFTRFDAAWARAPWLDETFLANHADAFDCSGIVILRHRPGRPWRNN